MNSDAFDRLSKQMGAATSRRGLLRIFLGGIATAAAGGALIPRGALSQSSRPLDTGAPVLGATATASPRRATATATAKPTETPKPNETATAKPDETATPKPDETATPKPEETATPKPESPKPDVVTAEGPPCYAQTACGSGCCESIGDVCQDGYCCGSNGCCATPGSASYTCCPSGQIFSAGACVCAPGQTMCGGTCCGSTEMCVSTSGGSECMPAAPTPCGTGECPAQTTCQMAGSAPLCCGPFNESCCDVGAPSCGGSCCNPPNVCSNGSCVPPGGPCYGVLQCGSGCCYSEGVTCINGYCCSNESCCAVPNSTDFTCCGDGQVFTSGSCCPSAQACNGICCASGMTCYSDQFTPPTCARTCGSGLSAWNCLEPSSVCCQDQYGGSFCCSDGATCLQLSDGGTCCSNDQSCLNPGGGGCGCDAGHPVCVGSQCLTQGEFSSCITCVSIWAACKTYCGVLGGGCAAGCDTAYYSCLSAIAPTIDPTTAATRCLPV